MTDEILDTKVIAGKYWVPIRLVIKEKRIEVLFNYNKILIAEIKVMEGAKYHGFDENNPRKIWSITNNHRNWFNLHYLMGKNPYTDYEKEPIQFETNRPLYAHQKFMTGHNLAVYSDIWAAEMGTGKTLSMIEVMAHAKAAGFLQSNDEAWYVGPVAGVRAVGRELIKWDSPIRPRMFTYEGIVKELKYWSDIRPVPKFVCFDESSKIKTPTAQRSQAALYLANAIRDTYKRAGYIVEMSGTPSPKDPTDWWHQAEVACPGFIREGTIHAFKRRLCLIEQRESTITGGVYPHVVTWLDDEKKCAICGQYKDSENHSKEANIFGEVPPGKVHDFKPSVNEVKNLHKRLHGLVVVIFKKDCLELPDKRYEQIRIPPSVELLRAAKLIRTMSTRAVQTLTLLRELSDGFQYKDRETGVKECEACSGKGTVYLPDLGGSEDQAPWEEPTTGDPAGGKDPTLRSGACPNCGGKGTVPTFIRETNEIGSPKDEIFISDLDEHEDIGRYVVWGGFQGTVDRLVRLAHQQGWHTLRVDGRGYVAELCTGEPADSEIFLTAMDRSHGSFEELRERFPKICFVGNPEAGGMALTLTASPTEMFFSNSFKGEARIQSEDRCHRIGMDENKGLIIKDLFLLPADEYVYNNLQRKRELQSLTLGEFNVGMAELEKFYADMVNLKGL